MQWVWQKPTGHEGGTGKEHPERRQRLTDGRSGRGTSCAKGGRGTDGDALGGGRGGGAPLGAGEGSGAGNRDIIKERNCENSSRKPLVTFAQANQPMHETTKCSDLTTGSGDTRRNRSWGSKAHCQLWGQGHPMGELKSPECESTETVGGTRMSNPRREAPETEQHAHQLRGKKSVRFAT